ncbi:MAG: FHA domain-containing protein [Tannerella sp.]|jgi:predicted Zn finger-like uncharacterized protein|nr:FHA domain-containing protein [Tannerella sp.]
MISVKCPHCKVGLRIDESRIPQGIQSFKCPKCTQDIPLSYLDQKTVVKRDDDETIVTKSKPQNSGIGRLTIPASEYAPFQVYHLSEGVTIVGRKANAPTADLCIQTTDKSMSRSHLRIEVKKNPKGNGYFHYLSDNNSKNHTLYNGKTLEDGDIVILNDNDEIVMGRTIVRFNE